jgi:hypothetical protein
MSNTAVALTIGGTVLVVGGAVAYFVMQKKAIQKAPAVAIPAAAAGPQVAAPAREMNWWEALAVIGGKALQEGTKYVALGGAGYAANVAQRSQKAA